ncbi:MAG: hypothetical protein RLZZ501_762 [Pseudomonadota bacterium]|jgi:regulator of RNase E activity RraA
MTIRYLEAAFRRLDAETLAAWREIPTAVASDCLNRNMAMAGAIQALKPGWRLCGQARTVLPAPGDNACVHWLCSTANPGEVVVVAAGGLEDVAMLGEMVTRQSQLRNLGGIVVDGAVRDSAAVVALDLPVFCRGRTARGPHKNFGGYIDAPAAVGGVAVQPGDLILGDEDGVVVVPLAWTEAVLAAARHHLTKEERWVAALERGERLVELFEVGPAERS